MADKKEQDQANDVTAAQDDTVETQAREQTGQPRVQLRIDESDLATTYANAFRTNGTAEEVMLDFGLNLVGRPTPQGDQQVLFQARQRVIMNYYSAKRLALTLSQIIRQHEQQFGELELDVAKRTKT